MNATAAAAVIHSDPNTHADTRIYTPESTYTEHRNERNINTAGRIIAAAESIILYISVTQFYEMYRAVLMLTKR